LPPEIEDTWFLFHNIVKENIDMKKYIILLATALLFGACSSDDDNDINPDDPNKAERTVLVYMAADNNLSMQSERDLLEMKEGSKMLGDRQNLIVYIDNSEPTSSYVIRFKNGERVDSTYISESNSADPAVLEEVLRYTREKYPAKSYGLVLWGHADAWIIENDSVPYTRTRAYGYDSGLSRSYWMNIPSMARAIANGMGGEHLRYIFADCCCFACIESAYELRNVTDYLIGSPAEIPDPGAPYQLIMPDLFNTSENFYESIINTYYDFYIEDIKERPYYYYNLTYGDLEGYSVPLAAIKSDELDNFAQATASLLGSIHDKLTPDGNLDNDGALVYDYYWGKKFAFDIYYTLSKNTAASEFDKWKPAFMKAVPYSRFSQKWLSVSSQLRNDMEQFDMSADECGVVSMFFPNNSYRTISPNLNVAIQGFQWNNVIRWKQYGW
jgi:hypothetical protein